MTTDEGAAGPAGVLSGPIEQERIPPDDGERLAGVWIGHLILAWPNGCHTGHLSIGTIEQRVLTLERRDPVSRARRLPIFEWWIQRGVERADPPLIERRITDG